MSSRTCPTCSTPIPEAAGFCPSCGEAAPTEISRASSEHQAQRLKAALADRYRIERELGRGGMAVVYAVRDLKHDRRVALKVLLPEVAATIGTERFLREIQISAKLNHPHILPLHDSGEAQGFLYYVMPLVDGESLRDRLNREKQLPVEEALRITREVAASLSYAHDLGFVHRDVKPENILLHHGEAMVADFGIAKAVSAASSKKLTATGLAVGTPVYMSPEQIAGESDLDGRSDIYSLACVLFEMLVGEPPFAGANVQATMARHALETAPSIRTVRGAVPDYVERAIARALAKTPGDRFQTATQFAESLAGVREDDPVPTPRHQVRLLLAAAVGAIAVVGGVTIVWRIAASTGPRQLIAFASERDGNYEIYVMNADGSEQIRLTNDPATDVSPAWSPDGRRLAFPSERNGSYGIYVMNADGSRQTRLTNYRDYSPAWSPDGRRIAFLSQRDNNQDIYAMNADGSGQVRLTNDPGEDVDPAWSADGNRIAFVSHRDANFEIYVMNVDGSGKSRLTNNFQKDLSPAWIRVSR